MKKKSHWNLDATSIQISPQKYEPIPLFLNQSMELFKLNQQQLVLNSTSAIERTLEQSTKVSWSENFPSVS